MQCTAFLWPRQWEVTLEHKDSTNLGHLDPIINYFSALSHEVGCKDGLLNPTNQLIVIGAEFAKIGGVTTFTRGNIYNALIRLYLLVRLVERHRQLFRNITWFDFEKVASLRPRNSSPSARTARWRDSDRANDSKGLMHHMSQFRNTHDGE